MAATVLAGLTAGWLAGAPAGAAPMNVSWTSAQFSQNGNSRLGDISNFASLSTPVPATTTDVLQTLGASLPFPGPANSDTAQTSVSLSNTGTTVNLRQASTSEKITGNVNGVMTAANGAGASSRNDTRKTTQGANGTATTQFLGLFQSNGTTLDLDYDGFYSLFAFVQQSIGGSLDRQRAFASATIGLTVTNVTANTNLFFNTLESASFDRFGFGVSSVSDMAFADSLSIGLAGTAGDTISVSLSAITDAIAYAGLHSFDTSGQATGATASASFSAFNFEFTTGEDTVTVPEPGTAALIGVGLFGLAGLARRWRR